MSDTNGQTKRAKKVLAFAALMIVVAAVSAAVAGLLVNIYQRKQEAKNPYLKMVNVTEDTTDPARWGMNWPREYDGYKRTVEPTKTSYGGGDMLSAEKLDRDPWLKRLFAGYAFSLDYRDRHGHAYMLLDQERTRRVTEKPQPGACLHCHASIIPAYRYVGDGNVMDGFVKVCAMPYKLAHDLADKQGKRLIEHPVSCVDCHDPQTMALRVTRPAFKVGIAALKAHQGIADYDVNRDASRQEMRSFVCGQCHVEYYFKGEGKTLTYPWANGLKVEEIEKYYDDMGFVDWKHGETGAPLLKAQHPEFETWNQGIHCRSGVACADCHMPYMREGALKVSDHWVRSPLLNVNRACQTCHHYPEEEIKARVAAIQERTHNLLEEAARAYVDMLDAVVAAQKAGASEDVVGQLYALQRKAQWRLDFVAAENSMGFHAPAETARILAESIDYSRQGQVAACKVVAVNGAATTGPAGGQ